MNTKGPINKKEAIDTFRHMLKVYNRINKESLNKIVNGAIKSFNDSHPDKALTNDQKISVTKRIAGLIYNDLLYNKEPLNTEDNKDK